MWRAVFVVLAAIAASVPIARAQQTDKTVILISLDGFHPDYLQRGMTPTLNELVRTGAHAPYVITSFVTKTFPNHWTIVTGLYPEAHGIISNTMYDPEFDETFTISNPAAVTNAKWWGGEPIWNTLIKNDYLAACYFWPGSEADVQGIRPTYYEAYNGSVSNDARVMGVIDWLLLPASQRPSLVTLYFSTVDDYGHEYGPASPMMDEALASVDASISLLVNELADNNLLAYTDIILVSDHGMAGVSDERERYLDDYIDTSLVDIIETSPLASLIPHDSADEETIYNQLLAGSQRDGNFVPFWKNGPASAQVPERLHYMASVRIHPILILMDDGWTLYRSSRDRGSVSHEHGSKKRVDTGGTHGYDNENASMSSLFIANGPSFVNGVLVDPFSNIEIYNLLCTIFNVSPAPNNGTVDSTLIQQSLKTKQ